MFYVILASLAPWKPRLFVGPEALHQWKSVWSIEPKCISNVLAIMARIDLLERTPVRVFKNVVVDFSDFVATTSLHLLPNDADHALARFE